MNDYDDSDEYSSAASFRARSNTWPLNRPDLAVPNTGICIDETLPEIELEEDDLFTTNENWSTGLVDHDIMSWDPILNAQNQQVSAAAAAAAAAAASSSSSSSSSNTNQQAAATIIHHHHQPNQQLQQPHHLQQQHQPQHNHHQQDQDGLRQRQQVGHMHTQQATSAAPKHHLQQLSQHHQQPPPPPPTLQQLPQHHHHHQHHDSTIARNLLGVEQATGQVQQQSPIAPPPPIAPPQPPPPPPSSHHHQQQHHHQHHQVPHLHQQQHQTLNSSLCLDPDDPNEYHIHQLHHLRLDSSNPHAPGGDTQQGHYVSSLSPVCIQGSTANLGNDSYNNSSDHQQHNLNHHLQPLSSARYDLDQHENYDLKPQDDELQLQTTSHHHHHHHHHLNHQHQQQSHHQLHHLTSSSLDNQSSASHMLSSSLSTSGIGLSGDLEDLDYKGVDPSAILNPYDDLPQHLQDQQSELQTLQSTESVSGEAKQSNSTSASKSKLNTPRRNAWGNLSYADLISQAINSTSDKRLTLSQIYDWMVQHVPYFKDKGDSNSSAGWKNSVRHNLSLHSRFKRLQNEGTGKSSWWTINPEANVGKCARRRAASMEASKYEKKRGRAKKRAEAIRQGLVSYPSLTNSSLNGSASTLEQQQQAQSSNQFQNPDTQPQPQEPSQQQQHVQPLDQFAGQHPAVPPTSSQLQAQPQQQTLDQYGPDQPSQQQQAHLQQLQQLDGHNSTDQSNNLHEQQQQQQPGLYMAASQTNSQYEDKNDNMLQQPHQHQQSQYYYQFEVSTAL